METTEQTPTEAKAAFTIDSERAANWLLRKLGNLDAEAARIKAQSETALRQIETDKSSLLFQFGAQLEAWACEEIQRRGGKRKSLALLQATLAFRLSPATVRIAEDGGEAISEAARRGYVKADLTAYRAEAVKAFADSGEVLPGCTFQPAAEKFAIRFPKGGDAEE